MKNDCSVKITIKRMKRQTTEWQEMFADYISIKRVVFRIQWTPKLNRKKTIQLQNEQKTNTGTLPKRICSRDKSI